MSYPANPLSATNVVPGTCPTGLCLWDAFGEFNCSGGSRKAVQASVSVQKQPMLPFQAAQTVGGVYEGGGAWSSPLLFEGFEGLEGAQHPYPHEQAQAGGALKPPNPAAKTEGFCGCKPGP
jgi:hypothetical protein